MQPNAPQPSFELPPLPAEAGPMPPSVVPERVPTKEVRTAAPSAQPAALSMPMPVSAPQLTPASMTSPVPMASAGSALSADDNDLIEKEWVVKAKQIVAATHDDPHAQNRELSKIKADYLKKRYGKDLKVNES